MQNKIKAIKEEIIDQYLNDPKPRPWIIGFSGGKDSTMLLQLIWYSLKDIPKEQRKREIHVVCNNTLVENPKILEYTNKVLDKISEGALQQNLPIFVHQTTPELEDSFWVNMIGKGYPAPNNSFRWCTDRLKINPTTKFIKDKVNEKGEVIILLGARSSESSKRANSLKRHEISGNRLRKHSLQNAYVYTPIHNITTDEVWTYLLQVPSPWGSSNKELVTIYRNADGGDCPLVIDKTTPSCGNSRFGCWVCTVVEKDKSMEGLIDNGEKWMEPLLEIREYLHFTRYNKDSRMQTRRDGSEGIGPYFPEVRKEILRKILIAQKEIQLEQPDIELITYQELVAIQVIWYRDNIFEFNVTDLYNSIFGTNIIFDSSKQNTLNEQKILQEICEGDTEDYDLIKELVDLQKSRSILVQRRGLHKDLENKIEQHVKSRYQDVYQENYN